VTGGNVPCGPEGDCLPGYLCKTGICVDAPEPTGCDLSGPEYLGWPDDSDLEPNDHPNLALALPCGDDGVVTHPADYAARCPTRQNYTNGYMNLVICPDGEQDFFAIYLLDGETVSFSVLYQYSYTRDVDARVWRWDEDLRDWSDDVAVGLSTNDNEQLTVSTATGSQNPPGWYYLQVFGKTPEDANFYTVAFTLNGSPN